MVRWLYDLYERTRDRVAISFFMEANFMQDIILDEFAAEGNIRGYQLPILPDTRKKPEKVQRIVHHLLFPGAVSHEILDSLCLFLSPFLDPHRIAVKVNGLYLGHMHALRGSDVGKHRFFRNKVANHYEAAAANIERMPKLEKYEMLVCYTDPSFKSTTANDYKACRLWGKTPRRGILPRLWS